MFDLPLNSALLIAVLQIVVIDILLGGDNAVVIALACRRLPPDQRRAGIVWGVVGAILLRLLLIAFAMQLLNLPFLKIAGALMLLAIGVQLLLPEKPGEPQIRASTHLLVAIRTIVIADAVMSLDNVVAIAGVSGGHLGLVALGILISVPIIVWGSQRLMRLMDRYPQILVAGAALLGWVAGGLWSDDAVLAARLGEFPLWMDDLFSALGAAIVVLLGRWLGRRRASAD